MWQSCHRAAAGEPCGGGGQGQVAGKGGQEAGRKGNQGGQEGRPQGQGRRQEGARGAAAVPMTPALQLTCQSSHLPHLPLKTGYLLDTEFLRHGVQKTV